MTDAFYGSLEAAWRKAVDDPLAVAPFLRELSSHAVLVILRQPPGPGAAAPERNLVHWQYQDSGEVMVPVFTDIAHLSIPIPPPAQAVRVPVRVLLAAGGNQRYVMNPLSSSPFDLRTEHLEKMRECIAEQSLESEQPSRNAPWAFRLPDDALYPVAVALVAWFNANGRVDDAYLYELTRGDASPTVTLGLNLSWDQELATTLKSVAVEAGANPDAFVVRFLPEEGSHRAGIAGINLEPFYRRP